MYMYVKLFRISNQSAAVIQCMSDSTVGSSLSEFEAGITGMIYVKVDQ